MVQPQPIFFAPRAVWRWAYRLAIPVAALLLFAALAMLWRWGPHTAYFAALTLFGFEPFRFPFLDIHAVLAAAQCQRLGIDVYLSNPCDALGRVHVYSPLWLAITPSFLDTNSTAAAGLGLDLMFILSLGVILRPATRGEVLILMFIALSPMTIYALERANCDLVVFLLVVGGCALGQARRPWRFGASALYLFAGLLKYYPLVLLALLLRERRREALIGVGLAAVIVLGLAGFDRAELVKALANIPPLSYFADSFSARNLPFGIAEAAFGPRVHTACACGAERRRGARPCANPPHHALARSGDARARYARRAGCAEPQCLLVGALLVIGVLFCRSER